MQSYFSRSTVHNRINMVLIAFWIDLVAYYEGSDGNVWAWHNGAGGWSNAGEVKEFRAQFAAGRYRGKLID